MKNNAAWLLVLGLALVPPLQASGTRSPRPQSDTPLSVSLARAPVVVFGMVSAMRLGDCGDIAGVGVAELRILQAGRGIDSGEGVTIEVCSPIRMLLGSRYVLVGELDPEGRLITEVDSIIQADGRCNRYYRVDYHLDPEVRGADGVAYYAVGQWVPDFAAEYSEILGLDLRRFERVAPPFCELD